MIEFLEKLIFRTARVWWSLTVPPSLRSKGVVVGKQCVFYGHPIVSMAPNSKIIIGDRVTICSKSAFTALGVSHPTVLRTLNSGATILIGNDTGISGGSICAAVGISIGAQCLVGADVNICDTDFHPTSAENRRYNKDPNRIAAKPITISDNVFIGTRSTLLKGVVVGRNSVVGAHSLVVHSIPDDTISAGIPARALSLLMDGKR